MYKTKHVPNGVDVKTSGLRQEVPRRHTPCPRARWDSSVPVCVLGAVIQWSRETVTCFEGKKQLIAFLNVPVSLGKTDKEAEARKRPRRCHGSVTPQLAHLPSELSLPQHSSRPLLLAEAAPHQMPTLGTLTAGTAAQNSAFGRRQSRNRSCSLKIMSKYTKTRFF